MALHYELIVKTFDACPIPMLVGESETGRYNKIQLRDLLIKLMYVAAVVCSRSFYWIMFIKIYLQSVLEVWGVKGG